MKKAKTRLNKEEPAAVPKHMEKIKSETMANADFTCHRDKLLALRAFWVT